MRPHGSPAGRGMKRHISFTKTKSELPYGHQGGLLFGLAEWMDRHSAALDRNSIRGVLDTRPPAEPTFIAGDVRAIGQRSGALGRLHRAVSGGERSFEPIARLCPQ